MTRVIDDVTYHPGEFVRSAKLTAKRTLGVLIAYAIVDAMTVFTIIAVPTLMAYCIGAFYLPL